MLANELRLFCIKPPIFVTRYSIACIYNHRACHVFCLAVSTIVLLSTNIIYHLAICVVAIRPSRSIQCVSGPAEGLQRSGGGVITRVILHSKFKTRDRHTIARFGKFQLSWWRHQMGTFSALLAFVRGIYNSEHFATWHGQTVEFPKDLSHTSGRKSHSQGSLELISFVTCFLSRSTLSSRTSRIISKKNSCVIAPTDGGSNKIRRFNSSWWRHQMEKFSALLTLCVGKSPVTREFPSQMPVTRSFDVFFVLHPNKRLSKHSWGCWFDTPSHSSWRHCNVASIFHLPLILYTYH